MLESVDSLELSAWLALAQVEAEEDAEREEDPEGWTQRLKDAKAPPPGILVRLNDDEPDEVPGSDG